MRPAPQNAFHGTSSLSNGTNNRVQPLKESSLFFRATWPQYDNWMNGGPHLEGGIPYANFIWEASGLRDRRKKPENVASWAKHIRSFAQLGEEYGMLFVTDNKDDAARYGEVIEIDIEHNAVVDVLEDPHVRTHRGWIVLLKAGKQIPVKTRAG